MRMLDEPPHVAPDETRFEVLRSWSKQDFAKFRQQQY